MHDKSIKNKAFNLAKNIIKILAGYRIFVDIGKIMPIKDGFVFETRPKLGTLPDANKWRKILKAQLNYPIIEVQQNRASISIIISQQEHMDNRLMPILRHPQFAEATKEIQVPYVVGLNYIGEPVIADLAKKNHTWLIGGSPEFGKSCTLISLVTSTIWSCDPDDIEIIIIDNGAGDLTIFESICTVISDTPHALEAIIWLRNDLEDRAKLKIENPTEFNKLKRRIIIIDEYPALVSGVGRNKKLLTDNVLAMLQRARKARYNVILAAQNPKLPNMGDLDLASATSRICLHCEKPVYSRTIIDCDDGAYLEEPGDLLFRSPQFRRPQRLKGSLITPEEIPAVIDEIRVKHGDYANYGFSFDNTNLIETGTNSNEVVCFTTATVINQEDADDKLYAQVLIWTIGRNKVSGNLINTTFETGERGGKSLIDRLHKNGIVGPPDNKKPRTVTPSNIEDLTEDAISFLERYGYSEDDIIEAFNARN